MVIDMIPTEAVNQSLKNPDEAIKTFENYLKCVKAKVATNESFTRIISKSPIVPYVKSEIYSLTENTYTRQNVSKMKACFAKK